MKKILISLLLPIAMNLMAVNISQYSARATLTLTSENGYHYDVNLLQSDEFQADQTTTGFASPVATGGEVFVYIPFQGTNYATLGLQDLGGMFLTVVTNTDTKYTFTYSKTTGNNISGLLYLEDLEQDSVFAMKSGNDGYEFTVPSNSTIANRFRIYKPAEPTICHQYGNLIITGHKGAKVKVLDMADQVAIAEQTLASDNEVISLSALTKGTLYQVVLGEDTMIIRVQ